MVSTATPWGRLYTWLGIGGGAVYLMVLPIGHAAALRSTSFLMVVVAGVALWSKPSRAMLPVSAAFGVWLIAACLSLLTSRDLGASMDAIENEILRSLIVFLAFYVLTKRLAALGVWVTATALGFAAISLVAIVSFVRHGEWQVHYVPPLGDYATSAITVLPLLVAYLVLRRNHWPIKVLIGIAIATTMVAGYLTLSRAFWLVVICGTFVTVLLHGGRSGRFERKSLVLMAGILLAALSIAAIVGVAKGRSLLYLDNRIPIYSAVAQKLGTNPVTGTGFGHETDKAWYAVTLPGTSVFHPHNIILSYLDQMGPFGALALVLLFCAPAWVLARVLRAPSFEPGVLAISGLVLLACVFVKNNLDYFFVKHNLWLFFAHLGIYFGHIERSLGGPIEARR